ncbi:MAG: lysophospholipid acyltransferase family protein [candidate division Zixibacteria bacterium]|nr:lysophospholipid acyltransferase family protein [Candidatus Tariuqbacter arcticus]
MNPLFTFLRKTVYLTFDRVVAVLGGYDNFRRVFKLAEITGALRNRIGYIGGASKSDYLSAIAKSFPEMESRQHKKILQDYWKDHQRMFLELFIYDEMTPENIGRLVDFQGFEHIKSALKAGKGAILPVPHIGSIRLLHYSLALKGYPVSVVSSGYADDPEIVRRYKLNETSRVHQVGFRGQNPRWIVQALRDNRLVQIASTAEAGSVGVEVNFMRRRLFFTSGWVRLAMITGSPILPAYIVRNDDYRHTVHIRPAFPLTEGADRNEIVPETAQAFIDSIEPVYHQHPHLIDWMSWQNRLSEAGEHFGGEA